MKRLRRRARRAGVRWRDVIAVYRDMRAVNRIERQQDSELRIAVWSRYCGPRSITFWRHGMRLVYRHAFTDGDMTNIPRWDEVADELGWDSQELFEFIASDYIRMIPRSELLVDALDYCLSRPLRTECRHECDLVF